jgi:hypothetical protein
MAKSLPSGRLLAAYVMLMVLCLTAVTVAGFFSLRVVSQGAQEMYFGVALPYSNLAEARAGLGELFGHMSEFAYVPDTRAASRKAAEADINEIEYQMELYRKTVASADEAALLRQFDQTWAEYRGLAGALFDQVGGGDEQAVAELHLQSLSAGESVRAALAGAGELKLRQAESDQRRASDLAKSGAFGVLAVGAVCMMLVAVLSAPIISRTR